LIDSGNYNFPKKSTPPGGGVPTDAVEGHSVGVPDVIGMGCIILNMNSTHPVPAAAIHFFLIDK